MYWENGVQVWLLRIIRDRRLSLCIAQIIDPHDKGISVSIAANLDPKRWDADSVLEDPLCVNRTREMVEAYFDHIAHLSEHK